MMEFLFCCCCGFPFSLLMNALSFLQGSEVEVEFEDDEGNCWYEGTVIAFEPKTHLHTVTFVDGDVQHLDFRVQSYNRLPSNWRALHRQLKNRYPIQSNHSNHSNHSYRSYRSNRSFSLGAGVGRGWHFLLSRA